MVRINLIEQIQALAQQIRSLRKGFITNFYLNVEKHSIWIEDGVFFVHETSECIFLLHNDVNFYRVFFIATSVESLCAAFQNVPFRDKLLSIDLIGAKENRIKDSMMQIGFYQYETLYRMRRLGLPEHYESDSRIENATIEDVHEVKYLLDKYFDPLSEQICSEIELTILIQKHSILIFREGDAIQGFIIYELQGLTLFLRYWWVNPSYRNRGIGSKLLHSFFYRGKNTKRQIHWIISSNHNAQIRYEHYGYAVEPLYNYVLLNCKYK